MLLFLGSGVHPWIPTLIASLTLILHIIARHPQATQMHTGVRKEGTSMTHAEKSLLSSDKT